ncbi:undecaprenyl-diphosphatase UppP [Candidatus Curtissbacteria bacterium RIFCSPLOWO2_01_FULL_39_62]|uniref:Undecaprenyl-diphosphatase n=2 Tax=Candidatus Curtissiibacteriota TaxID=1752717 RepID=A0A1F5GBY4_9BACT|nr:MAG: undecaprenyl-diphosphatase UppP [Candidatus Curtissbacteria bacterium RIFCSPHIGHO2_01_FULL_39_57]OGD89359.1 MAG: undecaprenyl-diphosphatase UppP [Candidatus Curtissbacteria bacterium RIFCSPHIGHO2_02_FULL_40_16b]OGD90750.1 MAG: undecaprenyl-diphosphatase UppP [Candidatus Curtissbacteria bacterium RIFCSPHIGHO2_12_FULL_38_37]OGE01040.1 MAG: undecaprenyl-diphosphatase UppP [Candidatus Curtissbacteria bacterium RIFCSPLOWO2_02_FULL_40_11]OGE02728.1 MAG: undecaprenyl-diphosphatase UppP [Candid
MNYFLAILAGTVQGLTEFLPVSSTGHLIIFENIFGISQDDFGLAFDASLHLGTLFAVILFFYKDYLTIFNFKNKLLSLLFIGTLPAVFFGIIFEQQISTTFRSTTLVAVALIVFSVVILWAERLGEKVKKRKDITLANALIIGIFQAIALIPGVSRSGATISGGLFLGLTREESARFAFLLSGPIIAGAGTKKFLEASLNNISASDFNFFIIGIISSAVFGFLTIKYFLQFLQKNTLIPFVIYRVGLAILLILAIFIS